MFAATLYESERTKSIQDIPEPRATQLRIVEERYPDQPRDALPIFYVSDDRDLSLVKPIEIPRFHSLDREILAPLLDALSCGDIELASALTPEGKRLMGYEVVKEPFEHYCYGSYAADMWTVLVEPGVYPIFAEKFMFHEAKNTYTNKIADFHGNQIWYDGIVTQDSRTPDSFGAIESVFPHVYTHQLAKVALSQATQCPSHSDNRETILIHPFCAKEYHFEYNGEPITTWGIEDQSLPELLPQGVYPIRLRNEADRAEMSPPRLADKIEQAKTAADSQSHEPGKTNQQEYRR